MFVTAFKRAYNWVQIKFWWQTELYLSVTITHNCISSSAEEGLSSFVSGKLVHNRAEVLLDLCVVSQAETVSRERF